MTSPNSGDTVGDKVTQNRIRMRAVHTVIPHGYICDNFLEHCLALDVLLVFVLSILQLLTKFLKDNMVVALDEKSTASIRTNMDALPEVSLW